MAGGCQQPRRPYYGQAPKNQTKMPVTLTEIKAAVKGERRPNKKSIIAKATIQENRLQLHTEASIDISDMPYYSHYIRFVSSILTADKLDSFKAMFRLPAATVSFTDQIFQALSKIFDGRNPAFVYEFKNPDNEKDWQQYRHMVLKGLSRWKTDGLEAMQSYINSIVVVDMPETQTSSRPDPYFYFLKMASVVDFETDDSGKFEWLIFKDDSGKVIVLDDAAYQVFLTKENSNEIEDVPAVFSTHTLGYCPARFFWTTPISTRNLDIKKAPITPFLGDLDLLLFFEVANEHLNSYARFPIFAIANQDCDFVDSAAGHYCDGGFLRMTASDEYVITGGHPANCPICAGSKRLDGPGTIIKYDPPNEANENADLSQPVRITGIDRDSLEYNASDIQARKDRIFLSATGYRGFAINDKAVNAEQVVAIFESLETALKIPQWNFEQAIKWTEETICLLRYGSENFSRASISLGTEHYIMTGQQLLEMYATQKAAGADAATLDAIDDKYIDTEFRNNPEEIQRQKIMRNLDPFRHRSVGEVQAMFLAGQVEYDRYMLKANLSSLVLRFERENMSIVEFASGLNFDKKIDAIQGVLLKYATELKPAAPPAAPAPVA